MVDRTVTSSSIGEIITAMRLFHFSENPTIATFLPRPVIVPSERPPGREWLNGPLVWAIDDWHQPMYLFPRDCPRILVWPTDGTTDQDREQYSRLTSSRIVAFTERRWAPLLSYSSIYRYELPVQSFESLDDAGMWVSRSAVEPLGKDLIADLPSALADHGVELRLVDDLVPLRGLWDTSLHVSGIRLRNAVGWSR